MTTKTDKRFMDEFEYYFLKKQINAREILKNEPQYIKRLSRDYQDVCFRFIKPHEYKAFFAWLAQTEPYFLDESKLEPKCAEWLKRKPSEKRDDKLSDSMEMLLCEIWGAAQLAKLPVYQKVSPIILWFDSAAKNRIQWKQKSEKDQQLHLWGWLRQVLSIDEMSLIEVKLREFQNISESIKQLRIGGEDPAKIVRGYMRKIGKEML